MYTNYSTNKKHNHLCVYSNAHCSLQNTGTGVPNYIREFCSGPIDKLSFKFIFEINNKNENKKENMYFQQTIKRMIGFYSKC